jgi:aminoglycoside 3-N-acetyltransferase
LAQALLGEHHLDDTPCGPHSPFHKLPEVDGQIVFLGCGLSPNTSMHGVEEIALPPYLFGPTVMYEVTLADGTRTTQCLRSHNFRGYAQRYERIAPLMSKDNLQSGMVMAALTHIVAARPMWQAALAAYQRDPLFFVESIL